MKKMLIILLIGLIAFSSFSQEQNAVLFTGRDWLSFSETQKQFYMVGFIVGIISLADLSTTHGQANPDFMLYWIPDCISIDQMVERLDQFYMNPNYINIKIYEAIFILRHNEGGTNAKPEDSA